MTGRAVVTVVVIGALVWFGLALLVAIAICRMIREAERWRVRLTRPALTLVGPEPAAPVHLEVYREWLDDGDPSAIRPPSVPPRLDVRP